MPFNLDMLTLDSAYSQLRGHLIEGQFHAILVKLQNTKRRPSFYINENHKIML